jgi:hypothetical protein
MQVAGPPLRHRHRLCLHLRRRGLHHRRDPDQRRDHKLSAGAGRPERQLQQPQPDHRRVVHLRRRRQSAVGRDARLQLGRREPAGRHHLSGRLGQGDGIRLRRARPAHLHHQHPGRRGNTDGHRLRLVRRGPLPGPNQRRSGRAGILRRGRVRPRLAGHALLLRPRPDRLRAPSLFLVGGARLRLRPLWRSAADHHAGHRLQLRRHLLQRRQRARPHEIPTLRPGHGAVPEPRSKRRGGRSRR